MKRVAIPAWLLSGPITLCVAIYTGLFMASHSPVGLAAAVGFLLVMTVTGGSIATLFCLGEGTRVRVPLPYPDRSRKLDERLMKVSVMKREVMKNIERLPEGNAYKSALRSRYDELAAAEEVLKVELTAKELISLDKRAARLVRKELG